MVGDITPADVKAMLNHWMYLGRSYSLVKKAYVLLNEYYTAGIKTKGLRALRYTFAAKLINGRKCADGSVNTLSIKAVADILGYTTTEITERYYVKKDNSRLTLILYKINKDEDKIKNGLNIMFKPFYLWQGHKDLNPGHVVLETLQISKDRSQISQC